MGRMARKQLYIEGAQDVALQREARRLGVTQAEVVRRAIDAWLAHAADDVRERAWQGFAEVAAEAQARYDTSRPPTPWTFSREDAYEGRTGRRGT